MSTAAEKRERQERILAELSELGLTLARDLQARALAAADIAEASELGLTFQRVSRSVRQTLALEAKLERDRQRADREDRDEAQLARTAYAEQRKAQVKIAVKRCVRYEHDGFDAENLLDELDDRLDEDALHDLFAGDDDIDLHIARMCAELGVPEPGCDEASKSSTGAASTVPEAPSAAVFPVGDEPEAQVHAPPEWRSSA
jgi:multidrug efflux pump subunit AcrA (membrane-fusion protein)